MKIFDCFLFFNELELLDLRLMTLSGSVDYFVLVEANRTFTDNKKEFVFERHQNRFKRYLNKIIYIKVSDTPNLDKSKDVWAIQYWQRDCITRGLSEARDEDRIIISDVDEIPNPDVIRRVRDTENPIAFNQYMFYYYVNCMSDRNWNGSIITPYQGMPSPQTLRNLARRGVNRIKGSGWHYSYMGGVGRIRSKLDNLVGGNTVVDKVGTDEDIIRKVNCQICLWDENSQYRLINIDADNYAPKSMRKFLEKYPNFYFSQK